MAPSLAAVPLDIQEALVLEDLIFVLSGVSGTYITSVSPLDDNNEPLLRGATFVCEPTMAHHFQDIVNRILPLATHYIAINHFIESRSELGFGLVNHALCAAVRQMMHDYTTLVCQLENAFNTDECFSLQKMVFYVNPTIQSLFYIYMLAAELGTVDDTTHSESSSDEEETPEEQARNEALGIDSKKLQSVTNTRATTSTRDIPIKGGEVLTIIYSRLRDMSGNPTASTIYSTLFKAASVPYVRLLREWMTTGMLRDPYEELFVKENMSINRRSLELDYIDEYWEGRYILRDGSTSSTDKRRQVGIPSPRPSSHHLPGGACVPPLLEAWKHKILLAGKYLNVIRECGIEAGGADDGNEEAEEQYMDNKFYKCIDHAYMHANRTLMSLLWHKYGLLPRLRSLKHFFLSNTFFLTHFLDLARVELRKSKTQANLVKLQSLLELVLAGEGGGGGGEQGHICGGFENVKVTMASSGLYEWLLEVVSIRGASTDVDVPQLPIEGPRKDKKSSTAMDTLTLDIHFPFPLCIVLSRKSVLRYQLLFRFHFHLQRTSDTLSRIWLDQKSVTRRLMTQQHEDLNAWQRRAYALAARMGAWVREIREFTMGTLQANWKIFEAKIVVMTATDLGGRTVEELLSSHTDYLDSCLKECMLTTSKLLQVYSKLIVTCSTFALYSSSFVKNMDQVLAGDSSVSKQAMMQLWAVLGKFEKHFDHWFKVHIDCVEFYATSEIVALLPLVLRLNSIKNLL